MRRLIVVAVIVAVAALVVVAVYLITRRDRDDSPSNAGDSSRPVVAATGSAHGRAATIPAGRIVRDAKRVVPDDAGPTRDPVLDMVMPPEWRLPPRVIETLRTTVPPQ